MNYQAPIRILLAEDDIDDQLLFADALSQISIPTELVSVGDGKSVIEMLEKSAETVPDIIFLDINMPVMNGIECLEKIKNKKEFHKIPCFILSTTNNETFVEKAYETGAHLYVVKPHLFNNLVDILEKVLGLNWEGYLPAKRDLFFVVENKFDQFWKYF